MVLKNFQKLMKRNSNRINAKSPDDATKTKIINRWRKSKLNSIPEIAFEFGLSQGIINSVINKYLSSKTNFLKKDK